MADIPRLNGAIRALEQGKPAFTAFAAPEINTAQALGAAAYDGVVFEMEHNPYDIKQLRDCMQYMLDRKQIAVFEEKLELDCCYAIPEVGRFRVNVYRKDTGVGATFRAIPTLIPSLDKLGLPPIVRKLCDNHQGMILVTGSSGTGKSTTLASMIDLLNRQRRLNIISLEDPIEFVHRSQEAQIIQREYETHVPSFAEGVRAAMREDPDVILVGEMRDFQTVEAALTAAETGHLVFATLHTTGAARTVDRIIDQYPKEQQEQIRQEKAKSESLLLNVLPEPIATRLRDNPCVIADEQPEASVLFADLAGFTRLMEGAETRTFRHLKNVQSEVWRPAIDAGKDA